MSEVSLEEVISEQAFAATLQGQAEMFFRLANTLQKRADGPWSRRDYFQLTSEADSLEAFLDDHGAKHNRTFHLFRELVASTRGFSLAGLSITHLVRRLDSYATGLTQAVAREARGAVEQSGTFVQGVLVTLLAAVRKQATECGLRPTADGFPEDQFGAEAPRLSLPRNVGQEDFHDEEQKVAEVASRYLQACELFERLRVRRIEDEREREVYLRQACSEERARVYEATVHNLQSAYDTYVKNTVLETKDARLSKLRGHASIALHLLEAVTHLTHFVERHEGGIRQDQADRTIETLVSKAQVRHVTLNHLLFWASRVLHEGRALAEDLLPSYMNVQVLEAKLPDDVLLHARPAALIVGIVNHYGTPVEMEIEGRACNAGSILELMVAVGSNPSARTFRFRGDENPLRDVALLFEHRLGEDGVAGLPEQLGYLKNR